MSLLTFTDIQAGDVVTIREESALNGVVETTGRVLKKDEILGTDCWTGSNFIILPEPRTGITRTVTLVKRLAPPPEKLSVLHVTWDTYWKNNEENQTLHYANGHWIGRLGSFTTSELVPLITEWSILLD